MILLTGGCFLGGVLPPRGVLPPGWGVSAPGGGGAGGDSPPGTATAAGGTHPTRMHSSWLFVFGLTLIFDYQWFTFNPGYFTENLPSLGCPGYCTPVSVAFPGSVPRRRLYVLDCTVAEIEVPQPDLSHYPHGNRRPKLHVLSVS